MAFEVGVCFENNVRSAVIGAGVHGIGARQVEASRESQVLSHVNALRLIRSPDFLPYFSNPVIKMSLIGVSKIADALFPNAGGASPPFACDIRDGAIL